MTREEASYRLEALLTMCDFRDAYGNAVDRTVYEEAVNFAKDAISKLPTKHDIKGRVIDADKLIQAIESGAYGVNYSAIMALGAITLDMNREKKND